MKNTTKKHKNFENNFAFIDSQNLYLAIKNQGWELDFAKFRIYLKDRFFVTQAFVFIGYIQGNESLYTYLQKSGYIVIHRPTLIDKDGVIKGNCDAELVLHAMIEYKNYDKAVIVSGDGDFHCLVEHLENRNKLKKLIIPNEKSYSSLLKKFRKDIVFLNGVKDKIGKNLAVSKRK